MTLLELLDASGLNQRELADKIGCTSSAVCHYVNGNRQPRLDMMGKMADALDVSIDTLATAMGYGSTKGNLTCENCRWYVDTADKKKRYCWRTSRIKRPFGYCDESEPLRTAGHE